MFWRSVPRQINSTFRAQHQRLIREKNDRISMAYLNAWLTRVKADKFPQLDRLLIKTKSQKTNFQDPEARWRDLARTAALSRKQT